MSGHKKTRRPFGNVRQLASGRWQARYAAPDGSPVTGPRTFRTKRDADDYLAEVQYALKVGNWRDIRRSVPTLDDYFPRFELTRRGKGGGQVRETTRALSTDQYRRFLKDQLGHLPLPQIIEMTVRDWYYNLPDHPNQRRQLYSVLRAIMNSAMRDELITSNPCNIPKAGAEPPSSRPDFTYSEVKRVWDQLSDAYRAVAQVAFYAHLRQGEVLALRWTDIDLASGMVRVHQTVSEANNHQILSGTKTAASRSVRMGEAGRTAARAYAQSKGVGWMPEGWRPPEGRMFLHPNGSVLRRFHIQGAWKRAREAAGLPGLRFNDLRHVGLTLVARDGQPNTTIMARAGHSTFRAALIYQNKALDYDAQAASALDRQIAAETSGTRMAREDTQTDEVA